MMADPTASSSSNSKDPSKDATSDLTNCQVILTDFNKTAASINDVAAQSQHSHQPSAEQSLNGKYLLFVLGMIFFRFIFFSILTSNV